MVKIGVDMVDIARFSRILDRWGERFAERVFTPAERASCQGSGKHRARCLSVCFAGKEAFLKALGTGLAQGIRWHDVEILRDDQGAPYYIISGRAQELFRGKAGLSLSHEGGLAIAVCVLEVAG